MKYIALVFISFVVNIAWAQEKVSELEQFEVRSYAPQKNSVTDLVFEARIDNLTETLTKNLVMGKLVDVSFKVYWLSPSQFRIEIQGLPKGFEEVRAELTALIKGKLEFVIPEKFSEKFKGYTLTSVPLNDGKLIHAIDTSYTTAAPVIDILFDKTGKLKMIESKAAMSVTKTEFFHSPKAWSNNKLVLDKFVTTSNQGSSQLSTTNTLEYINVNGVGFPSKMTIKNVSLITIPASQKTKEKKVKNETGTTIRFTKYEVNTGKAQRYIVEGIQR